MPATRRLADPTAGLEAIVAVAMLHAVAMSVAMMLRMLDQVDSGPRAFFDGEGESGWRHQNSGNGGSHSQLQHIQSFSSCWNADNALHGNGAARQLRVQQAG
jgi:hypothetical protein